MRHHPRLRLQDRQRWLIAVNDADHPSQCYVRLPFDGLRGHAVRLRDLMGAATYERRGDDLVSRGLYLDMPAWGYGVLELTAPPPVAAAVAA